MEETHVHELTACPVAIHPLPGSACFFGRPDPAIHELWFYVWIVRGPHGIGLIDTGLPAGADDLAALRRVDTYRDVVPLADVLAAHDVTPEEVAWCALTQTIAYHSGGLERALLPRAEVFLSRAGVFELLLDPPGHPPTDLYFTPASWSYLRELTVEGRLHLVDAATEIVPGVRFETTGGHHPGSAAVQVQTADGLVGILETAFLQENVDAELPIGIAEDAAACRRAIQRYRRECDAVLAGHAPENAASYGRR